MTFMLIVSITFYFKLIKNNIYLKCFNFSSAYSLEDLKCKYNHFPKGFMLGTVSSAYQIEGAWNDEGIVFYTLTQFEY